MSFERKKSGLHCPAYRRQVWGTHPYSKQHERIGHCIYQKPPEYPGDHGEVTSCRYVRDLYHAGLNDAEKTFANINGKRTKYGLW